ncbi:MAG: hypothetical protein IPO92_11420 [Saprospiraceae bacterium]|nr:hypothetical protein [Saprospiraceae bacterium]
MTNRNRDFKKIFKHKFLIAFIFVVGQFSINGQQIHVFNTFEELESALFKQNDTTYVINFGQPGVSPA